MKKEAPKKSSEDVTFVADPFQIRTPEISEMQNDDEAELDDGLDQDLDEEVDELNIAAMKDDGPAEDFTAAIEASNEQLDKLASALALEHEKNTQELEAQVGLSEEEKAAELAQQIAEDEALAKLEQEGAEDSEELNAELAAALPKRNESGELDPEEVQSCIETFLFMSDKPLSLNKLKDFLGAETESQVMRDALAGIQERYSKPFHGFELVEVAGGYQFRTKPSRAALAMKLAKVQTQRLSRGAMETLAIISYKQPAMKEDVDSIRGVDSSHFIRVLLDKKLIQMSGRSELPGRPILYSTTNDFLEIFGLKDLSQLPPLKELEQMIPTSETGEDDPKVKEMRRLVSEMKADRTRLAYDPREDEKLLGEIRERVKEISTSTPYIEEMKLRERAEKEGIPYEELLIQLGMAPAPEAAAPVEAAPEELPAAMVAPAAADPAPLESN